MATYPSTYTNPARNGAAVYQQNQINQATPAELMLKVYDIAIAACGRKDIAKSKAAIIELIDSLNFEYAEIATGLFRLYNYCLDLLRAEKFDEAKYILSELRATWAIAIANLASQTPSNA